MYLVYDPKSPSALCHTGHHPQTTAGRGQGARTGGLLSDPKTVAGCIDTAAGVTAVDVVVTVLACKINM